MVLPYALAAVGAAGTIYSGMSARKAAKKTQKLQMEHDRLVNEHNQKVTNRANKRNTQLGKQLAKRKEVTTEQTTGTNTRSSSTKVSNTSSFDADAMLAAAEKSGINPITFLRNGGMAAFIKSDAQTDTNEVDTYGTTVTTTRKGHNDAVAYQMMMDKPYLHNGSTVPHVPGAGEAVGQGVAQFANAAGDIVARQGAQDFVAAQAEKHQAFQRELMMMSLGGAQKSGGGAGMPRSFFVPGFSTSGPAVKRQTQGGLAISPTPLPMEQGDASKVTNPNAPWWLWPKVDPTVPDVKNSQDRRGESELAETMNYVHSWMNDGWYNLTGLTNKERYERFGKPVMDFIGGLGVSYDPNGNKGNKPLTFTVKPRKAGVANGR